MAESPRSGLASSGPNPGKKRPSAGPTGVVNHSAPVAATRSPNSTPLRAMVVTRVEFSTPTAASIASLAPAIEMLRAKWSLPARKFRVVSIAFASACAAMKGASRRVSSDVDARLRLCPSSPIASAWLMSDVVSIGPDAWMAASTVGPSTSRIQARRSSTSLS